MTKYIVQYELPVNNPDNNIGIRRGKSVITFFVPLNHPDAHLLGFADLLERATRNGKLRLIDNP